MKLNKIMSFVSSTPQYIKQLWDGNNKQHGEDTLYQVHPTTILTGLQRPCRTLDVEYYNIKSDDKLAITT